MMMTWKERVLHAILFEMGALGVSTAAMWVADLDGLGAAAMVGVLLAITAMAWNVIFNFVYDQLYTGAREQRGFRQRALHAVLFEGGLLLATMPMLAYCLDLSWWNALLADLGLTLVILVYTVVFNWIYDLVRLKFIK